MTAYFFHFALSSSCSVLLHISFMSLYLFLDQSRNILFNVHFLILSHPFSFFLFLFLILSFILSFSISLFLSSFLSFFLSLSLSFSLSHLLSLIHFFFLLWIFDLLFDILNLFLRNISHSMEALWSVLTGLYLRPPLHNECHCRLSLL